MNSKTHIAITKRAYELLPDVVREFIGATGDEISFWAVYPDRIDQDNVDGGYWYHSRKMTKVKNKYVWKHGSLSLAIGGLRWNFRTYYKTGDFKNARECLLRMFHYAIDACTMPHVVFKEADHIHSVYEKDMEKNIYMEVAEIKTSNQPLKFPASIYDSTTNICEETYEQKDKLLEIYKDIGGDINKDHEMKMMIIRRCIQSCVDLVSSTYLGISQEDNSPGLTSD